jgi:hypothetical protein
MMRYYSYRQVLLTQLIECLFNSILGSGSGSGSGTIFGLSHSYIRLTNRYLLQSDYVSSFKLGL